MNAGLSTGNVGLILAGGIAGTAGTLVNATFGTKTDEEALKSVNNTISANKFFQAMLSHLMIYAPTICSKC